jgi:hypothetical protein
LTGPWKKNRPGVQALNGTEIVISVLWPGASVPPAGEKVTCPGTFVKATQCRLLDAFGLESTSAWHIYVPFFVQSRCPRRLIDCGRTSRMAGTGAGEDLVGWGVTAGCGVGFGVGGGVGDRAGDGMLAGTRVGAGVRAGTVFACPVVPQEARIISAMVIQKTTTILLFLVLLGIGRARATGPREPE